MTINPAHPVAYEVVTFTRNSVKGYDCDLAGNQSGEYVSLSDYKSLDAAAVALRAALDDQHAATDRMHNELTALRAERDAALARVEKAEKEAQETYREFICPKCETEFEDDGKEHPSGLMCPECKGNVKGVIHPRTVKRYVSQGDWEALTARVAELQAALQKFGRHDYTCVTTNYDNPETLGVVCDCGLGAALNGEKK